MGPREGHQHCSSIIWSHHRIHVCCSAVWGLMWCDTGYTQIALQKLQITHQSSNTMLDVANTWWLSPQQYCIFFPVSGSNWCILWTKNSIFILIFDLGSIPLSSPIKWYALSLSLIILLFSYINRLISGLSHMGLNVPNAIKQHFLQKYGAPSTQKGFESSDLHVRDAVF